MLGAVDSRKNCAASTSSLLFFLRRFNMAKLERDFQSDLIREIKELFPGCLVMKNDSGYIQGIPDWTVLYKNKWAVLEIKRKENANRQPNQDYYVNKCDDMSFSRFVYPENVEEVMNELYNFFEGE